MVPVVITAVCLMSQLLVPWDASIEWDLWDTPAQREEKEFNKQKQETLDLIDEVQAKINSRVVNQQSPLQPTRQVIYLGASWCGPCQSVKQQSLPALKAAGWDISDAGHIREVDIDREPEMARHYRVGVVPTFILLVDGREVARRTGVLDQWGIGQMYYGGQQ